MSSTKKNKGVGYRRRLGRAMNCIWSGEHLRADEIELDRSSESLDIRDFSASRHSSRPAEIEDKPDDENIEEAESSLREAPSLNYEAARALLGRLEYQKGNKEGALQVYEGIDIAAVIPKIKLSISIWGGRRNLHSHRDVTPPMSMPTVGLLLEAIFLKSKSLQDLGRCQEAAQSCKVILDTVESALPEGLSENFATVTKLQETLSKAVELLPELWKVSGSPQETILSYRRALLHHWNLDMETTAKIQKEFAIFLLYGGYEASPPNLRSQMEGSFIPRNNIEEAALLLLILLRKFARNKIEWDPSIMEHLSFALSVSGETGALANQVEELLPGIMDRKERYYTLALCYYGKGEDLVALNLLRKLLSSTEDPNCVAASLLASKICAEKPDCAEEGIGYARNALNGSQGGCPQLQSVAICYLGVSLSTLSRSVSSDSERTMKQSEALKALETAESLPRIKEPKVIYHLSLENAEQRKLDVALLYAKQLLQLEAGSNVKGWILLARILSAQKHFVDAEAVINAAIDQTGRWEQGELLRTKAKLQIAQGQLKDAVETYTHLLAFLQVQRNSFGAETKLLKGNTGHDRCLEMETWHDLAIVYINLSQWQDAEICLSRSKDINPHSASRWHATGLLFDVKGFPKEALKAYIKALEIEPSHVPSLVSKANALRKQLNGKTLEIVRCFLTDALRLDRMNPSVWYSLGLHYKAEGGASATTEAAECFETAARLEETAPVEPFR